MREDHLSVKKVTYLMPRFVSPIKLSKLGLDPPTFSNHLQDGHEFVLPIGHIDKYNLYKDIVYSMAEAPL